LCQVFLKRYGKGIKSSDHTCGSARGEAQLPVGKARGKKRGPWKAFQKTSTPAAKTNQRKVGDGSYAAKWSGGTD